MIETLKKQIRDILLASGKSKLGTRDYLNSIYTMRVYRHESAWVFDNPAVGLLKEPFVAGADEIFDEIAHVRAVDPSRARIDILFSDAQFPGWQILAEHLGPSMGGDDYQVISSEFETLDTHEFWLCPALLKYFADAPDKIFMKVTNVSTKA
tara:strand:- start:427 stop:882 length:456 start_codon:yes stop_codon:yes gene_type:complete